MEEAQIGRYVIVKEIGRGGQSYAYLAKDPAIGRTVAIKQIRAAAELQDSMRAEFVRRFLQEARVVGTLSHPNIVSIYDMGEDEAGPYIVMEFIDGETLDDLIERSESRAPETIIPIFLQICSGLHFAHQNGVVHRDVKPANIMLTRDGVVKLLDFGVARVASTNLTQTGTLLGTPSYMSPEQIQGEKVDRRSDIFSLGIVLYEALTGGLPFAGKNPTTMIFRIVNDPHLPLAEIDANLAGAFGPVIDRCLAKSPEDRYPDCQALAEDLNLLLPADAAASRAVGTAGSGVTPARGVPELAETEKTWIAGGEETVLSTPNATPPSEHSLPLSRKTLGIIGLAVAGVVMLAVLAFFLTSGSENPVELAGEEGLPEEMVPASQQQLAEARAALADGKLVGENEDDALHLAREALAEGETAAVEIIEAVEERLRDQTLRKARQASPREAVAVYDDFLTYFPEDAAVSALQEQLRGRITEANQLRRLEELASRGQAALAKGELDEAVRAFEQVLKSAPNDSQASHMLGKALAAKGDLTSARRHLQRAVSLSPLDAALQVELAGVLEQLGKVEEAAAAIERAIGLGAPDPALEARLNRMRIKQELDSLLPARSDARHKHFLLRSCKGTLTVTNESIEYAAEGNSEHSFQYRLRDLQSFAVSKGSLEIASPDGKKYDFEGLTEETAAALSKVQQVLDAG